RQRLNADLARLSCNVDSGKLAFRKKYIHTPKSHRNRARYAKRTHEISRRIRQKFLNQLAQASLWSDLQCVGRNEPPRKIHEGEEHSSVRACRWIYDREAALSIRPYHGERTELQCRRQRRGLNACDDVGRRTHANRMWSDGRVDDCHLCA